jgi:hypothetical protein
MGLCISLLGASSALPEYSPYICSESQIQPSDALNIRLDIAIGGSMTVYIKNISRSIIYLPVDEILRDVICMKYLTDIEMGDKIPYKGSDVCEHKIYPMKSEQRLIPGTIHKIDLGILRDLWIFNKIYPSRQWNTLAIQISIKAMQRNILEGAKDVKVKRKVIFRVPSEYCYSAKDYKESCSNDKYGVAFPARVPELPTDCCQIQIPSVS